MITAVAVNYFIAERLLDVEKVFFWLY